MTLKSFIYKALRVSNDVAAVKNGRVGKRMKNRFLGGLFWRLFR